jgi:hypothetical protein
MEQIDQMVETAYTTYVTAMGGQDLERRPLAPYADLPVAQQQAWREALLAAMSMAGAEPAARTDAPPAQADAPVSPPAAPVPDEEDERPASRGRK